MFISDYVSGWKKNKDMGTPLGLGDRIHPQLPEHLNRARQTGLETNALFTYIFKTSNLTGTSEASF